MQISVFNRAQCVQRVPSRSFWHQSSHKGRILHIHPNPYSFSSNALSIHCVPTTRPLVPEGIAAYEPSVWGENLINHTLPSMQKPKEWMEQRITGLKEEVRDILKLNIDKVEIWDLIDTIKRLGVAYHFEKEIDDALTYLHGTKLEVHNLYHVALCFRLLRQHGFPVSSDEFYKFQDDRGNFPIDLCEDPKGLLSLYNAGYVAIPGEVILDDSISFAKQHLLEKVDSLKSPLKRQVLRALKTPLHKMLPRVEAMYFIEEYEEEPRRSKSNDILLEFAKLDYNLLQSLHFEEARALAIWWKKQNLEDITKYGRDRIIESYIWGLGLHFEPQNAMARIIIAKYYLFLTLLDDTIDRYGTLEECRLLNDAIQMWDEKATDKLPIYMKDLYLRTVKELNGFEHEIEPSEKFRLPHIIEAIQRTISANMQEVEWRAEGYIPTFSEQQRVSVDEQACMVTSAIGIAQLVSKDAFRWLTTMPDVIIDATMVCRFVDDIVGFEREKEVTTLKSYMMEHNLTKEAAVSDLRSFIDEGWKRVNKACLRPTDVSIPVLTRILDYVRIVELLYNHVDDGFTKCSQMKELITSVLLKPFSL